MIPKIIHYCWLSGDPIPENLQKCMNSWKKFLPDYEFILWDRNRFDINSTLWTKQAFEAKKYAFAADYIRLYAVYNYGGIYMDMDVEVVKSFNELLSSPYIWGMEAEKGIEAGVFGAEQHALFLKDCLNYYNNRPFILQDGTYDRKVLPVIIFERFTLKYTIKKREKKEIESNSSTIYVFPPDFLTAKSYETGKIHVTKNTYTIHHFAGSWFSKKEKITGGIVKGIYRFIRNNSFLYTIYKNTYRKLKQQLHKLKLK